MTIKKGLILLLAVMALFVFFGCASDPEPTPEPPAREIQATQKTEVLEHKGTVLGLTTLPPWIEVYITQSITAVEGLDDYKGMYCFIEDADNPNKDAAVMWAENFNIAQAIAGTISTRVESVFEGVANSEDSEYTTEFTNKVITSIDAEIAGAKNAGSWWIHNRRYESADLEDYEDMYTAYVLYTIPQEMLDDQIENAIDKIAEDGNLAEAELSVLEAAKALISEKGLPSEK